MEENLQNINGNTKRESPKILDACKKPLETVWSIIFRTSTEKGSVLFPSQLAKLEIALFFTGTDLVSFGTSIN